jgi:hypothetical protein
MSRFGLHYRPRDDLIKALQCGIEFQAWSPATQD